MAHRPAVVGDGCGAVAGTVRLHLFRFVHPHTLCSGCLFSTDYNLVQIILDIWTLKVLNLFVKLKKVLNLTIANLDHC